MRVNFGDIEAGSHIPVHRWLDNIQRYPSVRFFGFVRGRFFIGLLFGSKGMDKADRYAEEISRLCRELDEARREIVSLKPNEEQAK